MLIAHGVGTGAHGDACAGRLILALAAGKLFAELADVGAEVHRSGGAGPLGAPGAPLLAAALSGRPSALAEALQARAAGGGLGAAAGLSALHAASHGLPNAVGALTGWKAALAGAVCGLAAPHLTISTAV